MVLVPILQCVFVCLRILPVAVLVSALRGHRAAEHPPVTTQEHRRRAALRTAEPVEASRIKTDRINPVGFPTPCSLSIVIAYFIKH